MSAPVILKGITWNHTRGFCPKVATAQRWHELNPGIEIRWEKRSLQAFADESIEDLAKRFDLLVIDHPSIGEAAAHGIFRPLEGLVSADAIADSAAASVGASHASYEVDGHQWALPVDAATPVASWREDLLQRLGVGVPTTWGELLVLARRGAVAVPAIPIDSLMNLYMLWLDEGEAPGSWPETIGRREAGLAALEALKELVSACDAACLTRNPIQTYEAMTQGDAIAYLPFAYGYSNYARPGYARRALRFGGLVRRIAKLRSTLGGAGMAISARSAHPREAADYLAWVMSAPVQQGLFADAGGQPGHRAAWLADEPNRTTGGYFAATLPTLDDAWVRPRYPGYIGFQDAAGHAVHAYLRGETSAGAAYERLDALHRAAHRAATQGAAS
ncbi:extracellular solute-binding protein [Rhizobacter sp. Root404]|uniref:extracellular solute-binding protein n=1 Tax=Rhizobacter sp. Root404 TaxID=1736528 RepID=UPI0006F957AB|nr:extracellular solute-binding protein [Rhizobacter sp. Root404]KQW38542.1 ABC transporter substrate-binding protein [Rhizobacter sp. Root404]